MVDDKDSTHGLRKDTNWKCLEKMNSSDDKE